MIVVSASFILWLSFVFLIIKLEKIRKANFKEVQLISSSEVSIKEIEMKEISDEQQAPEILENMFLKDF